MSKEYWIGKLKLIAVLAVLVATILGLRYLVTFFRQRSLSQVTVNDSIYPERLNEDLERIEGSGTVPLMENDNFIFALDFSDGNFEVTVRETGYVWRSAPTDEEMAADEKANALWSSAGKSPILVEYIKALTDAASTILHVDRPGYKIDVYKLPDGGVRVDYQYTEQQVAVALDYYLRDDYLEVDQPNYMVRELPLTYKTEAGITSVDTSVPAAMIYRIQVLPYFGASLNEGGGYLMVPDGKGALIRFDENRDYFATFTGMVYGSDFANYSYINGTMGTQRFYTPVYFPVYGINRGSDESLLAIINYGEANALITASPADMQTSYNNIYAGFVYRTRFSKFYNMIGEGTYTHTERMSNTSHNIHYRFLSGEKSDYVGMGEAYRDYLMDVKGLERITVPENSDLPFELSIYGGDMEAQAIISRFITMTTFDQAKDIVSFYEESGIKNMNVVYDGWYKRGNATNFPDRFPPAGQLGGESGMKSLVDFVHERGYKMFLTDWNLVVFGMNFLNNQGISTSRDVVYDIQETPLNWGNFFEPAYVLRPEANRRVVEESLKKYKEWGIDGVEEFDTEVLVTDYNPQNPMTRRQFSEEMNALYRDISTELGSIRIWQGLAHTLVNGATVIDAASGISNSPLMDEYVPVYSIACRGLIDFVTTPVNTMNDIANGIVNAAELGQTVSFELTANDTVDLFYAYNSFQFTSTQFENFQDYSLQLYNQFNETFADTQGLFITNHETLEPNITRTTYENGKMIICNYRVTPYEYEGVQIPPLWFAVETEGEVTVP